MHANLSAEPISLPWLWKITLFCMRASWRLRYRRYLHVNDRKWGRGNLVVSLLLHWYCQIVFCCDYMIKCYLKSFNIFRWHHTMCLHRTGAPFSVNAIQSVHNVVSHSESTHVLDPFRAPLLGYQITNNWHNKMCPINWALAVLRNAEIL